MNELQMKVYNKEELNSLEIEPKDYLGYVYVIDFEGMVKIGSTKKPIQRIKRITNYAKNYFGIEFNKAAISVPHINYYDNEKEIHDLFSSYRIKNSEMFEINFDTLIKGFSYLEYYELTDEKKKELEERKEKTSDFFKRIIENTHDIVFEKNIREICSEKNSLLEFIDLYENRLLKCNEALDCLIELYQCMQ